MVTGSPGMGGGPPPPPSIKDTESQAFVEVTKKYVLAMVRDTLAEVIPFTQMEYDEVFQYRAEADKPTLHPLLRLRVSGLEPYVIPEETWQPAYQELLNALPAEVKEWLTWEMNKPFADRDPNYVVFNNLLLLTAKSLVWLEIALRPIQPNTRAEQAYLQNIRLPFIALRNVQEQSRSILATATNWLNAVGPNHPDYNILSNALSNTASALSRFERLRQEIESGNTSPAIKQRLVETANELSRLSNAFRSAGLSGSFGIFQAQLDTLATVAAAWALPQGSPSMLLSLAAALTGLGNTSGVVGGGYLTAIDAVVDGILNAVLFGSRAEIQELTTLYNELNRLAYT